VRLHQQLRELRAAARRGLADRRAHSARRLLVVERKAAAAGLDRAREAVALRRGAAELRRAGTAASRRRGRDLARLPLALATLDLCREGRELVDHCATELEAVGRGLEELRLDELVERLEAGRPNGSGAS